MPYILPYIGVTGLDELLCAMIIANFTTESCRVTDGMICVASDIPYGEPDLTSDNDLLPPVTTIWLAGK